MRLNLRQNLKRIVKYGLNAFNPAGWKRHDDHSMTLHCSFSSYNHLLSVKEELEQKYLHLSQVYESEAKTKYQYLQQVEELSGEVRELRREVSPNRSIKLRHAHLFSKLSHYRRQHHLLRTKSIADDDSEEIRKIKKVQSLCRGWLYRQRWKRIVEEYIRYLATFTCSFIGKYTL